MTIEELVSQIRSVCVGLKRANAELDAGLLACADAADGERGALLRACINKRADLSELEGQLERLVAQLSDLPSSSRA